MALCIDCTDAGKVILENELCALIEEANKCCGGVEDTRVVLARNGKIAVIQAKLTACLLAASAGASSAVLSGDVTTLLVFMIK
jgi:hypothetical protein